MDELLLINVPWSQEFSGVLKFCIKAFCLLTFILIVASRRLHPYSSDDKTSRLMVKRFSTVRDTQRGSQSYTEKRRGRKEIEVTRRRRERIKRGERSLASNQFPMCSPQCEHSDRFMELYREEKRRRRKETEVTSRRKGGNQKKRDRSSQ